MRIPIIMSLLMPFFMNSNIINSSKILNNIIKEAEEISHFLNLKNDSYLIKTQESNEQILSAYIDGEDKVFFNDINNENIIEDTWKYNEVKTIHIEGNLKSLGSNKKLEITLPKGMRLRSVPEDLVDGKIVTNVNKDSFKNEYINATNSNYVYNPDCGTIVFDLADTVSFLSLDILISVDDFFWDSINDRYANQVDLNSIEIKVRGVNNEFTKKIDHIKINGADSKMRLSTSFPDYIKNLENTSITSSVGFPISSIDYDRFYKKIIAVMEIPKKHIEPTSNTQDKFVDINKIVVNNGGKYEIVDNYIVVTWENVYGKNFSFSPYLNLDSNIFRDGDRLEFKIKGAYLENYFTNEVTEITGSSSHRVEILLSNREILTFNTDSPQIYQDLKTNNKEIYQYFGGVRIQNKNEETDIKELEVEFSSGTNSGIGITMFKMPTQMKSREYNVKYELWDKNSDDIFQGEIDIITTDKNNTYTGHIIDVQDLINNTNIDNIKDREIYIKKISYELGSIPKSYISYMGGRPNGIYSSGNMYGKILDNVNYNMNYATKFKLKTVSEDNDEVTEKVAITNTKIITTGSVAVGVHEFNFRDENQQTISNIMAGTNIMINGRVEASSYQYGSSTYWSSPIFYIRLPKGISIDEKKTYFSISDENGDTDIPFYISNINSPRVLSDKSLVYEIEFYDENVGIGFYNRNLSETGFGHIKYNIALNIPKSVRTTSLNARNTLYIGDKIMDVNGWGSWEYYYTKDELDIDGDGNTTERIATYSSDKYLNITSNTTWLDVDISSEGSNNDGDNNYQPIEDTSDVVKYGLTINNNNDGYVRTGKMEYFIPVPKKDVEYNSYVKEDGGTFNFDMELTEKVEDTLGFDISYTYNNEDYLSYSDDLDLNKVSMVRVINNRDISPGETIEFKISMKYSEDSWNGDENVNSWNIYGQQTYEKNGLESTFLHVLDTFNVELLINPKILKNPESKSVKVGESVTFSTNIDVGIPIATGNWQYRESSNGNWIDLNETSTTLFIDNVSYNLNGYEYRYVATNKGATVESLPATLTVIDKEGPIITLNEFKDGDVYKITITAIDNGSGISHIILPDGSRVDSNTHTMIADVNTEYTFKVYDLAGNESIKSTIIGVIVPDVITSNLDVYIKSENILQMSLDTNSITFDDFSGVEDAIKENAINLTINSSLPYSINAYLPTEVQNSDKSKTMNKEILNIKENSETDYKNFANINEKVVLKDNCSAGNRLNHGIDIKLKGRVAHEKDVYKTTIKFEVEQK